MIDFAEQSVVVTGAGRGLGRLYALDLARRGASVVVNDLGSTMGGEGADPHVADSVVAEIEAAGGTAVASHESVATAEGGASIVQLALDSFGRLDAVVSNAGIFHTAPFEDLTGTEWTQMIDVHVHGSFHLSQPAYVAMKERGGGRFVFITSSAGLFGQPNSAHYAAAKAAIVGLANVIAIEGEPHGILANTVAPFGFSRMVTETVGEIDPAQDESGFLSAIAPEKVVPMVTYLASSRCSVTHQNYSACAGRFARAFVGLAQGWMAPSEPEPTAEDIEANWEAVSAIEPFSVPGSIFDEVTQIADRLNGLVPNQGEQP